MADPTEFLDIIEDLDGLTFPLRGLRVTQIAIDHGVTLRLHGGVAVAMQGSFIVADGGAQVRLDVRHVTDLSPALAVLDAVVDHARASWDGLLRVAFAGGREFFVWPSDDVESWFVSFPDGRLYASRAGGGIAARPDPRG